MKLTIEQLAGTWKIEVGGRSEFADTLEQLVEKADPGAPLEYVMHTTSILSGILGLQYEPEFEPVTDFSALAELLWGDQDSPDHWEPEAEDESDDDDPDDLDDSDDPAAEGVVERIEEYTNTDEYPRGV